MQNNRKKTVIERLLVYVEIMQALAGLKAYELPTTDLKSMRTFFFF